jgi:hypothetical protein
LNIFFPYKDKNKWKIKKKKEERNHLLI